MIATGKCIKLGGFRNCKSILCAVSDSEMVAAMNALKILIVATSICLVKGKLNFPPPTMSCVDTNKATLHPVDRFLENLF